MGGAFGLALKAGVFVLLLGQSLPALGADAPLVLAVHPYLPAAEIEVRFAPLAGYLTGVLGLPVRVRVGKTYAEHLATVGRDQVDIAFLGPAGYIEMTRRYGRKPLLAGFALQGETGLRGVIATRRDSPIRTLAELRGRDFAFGDRQSTMSHLVPRYMLQQVGIDLDDLGEYRYLGSHRNVALAVLAGDFAAGAMKREVFDEFAPHGLRVLAVSPSTPDHLFVSRAGLPADVVWRLRRAFSDLAGSPGGPGILDGLHKGLTRLAPVRDADYDDLRTLLRHTEPTQP